MKCGDIKMIKRPWIGKSLLIFCGFALAITIPMTQLWYGVTSGGQTRHDWELHSTVCSWVRDSYFGREQPQWQAFTQHKEITAVFPRKGNMNGSHRGNENPGTDELQHTLFILKY